MLNKYSVKMNLLLMLIYEKLRGIILETGVIFCALITKEGSQMPEEEVGKVSDFFARPVVAGIEMNGNLKLGDKIHITGHTTDLEMVIDSMQINNVNVTEAKPGDSVGIKVPDRVRRGDTIYKVID
jgi:translation elongation factor EF-Tu-like GTPase